VEALRQALRGVFGGLLEELVELRPPEAGLPVDGPSPALDRLDALPVWYALRAEQPARPHRRVVGLLEGLHELRCAIGKRLRVRILGVPALRSGLREPAREVPEPYGELGRHGG
jgi:hypothetical protein